MKNLLIILLLASYIFSGCKKEEECETNNTGTGCFQNNSASPVSISVDGSSLFTIAPYQSKCSEFSVGSHSVTADNGAGIFIATLNVEQCESKTLNYNDPCDTVVCQNGGTCIGGGTCQCPSGYTGTHCENLITGLKITEVVFTSYAPGSWDVFSDPDIYMVVEGSDGTTWATGTVQDAVNNYYYFLPGLPVTLTNYSFEYPIYFYDWDNPGADLMLTLHIQPSDYSLNQTTITFTSAGWDIAFLIEWQIN